jgi:hypothetical protein
LTDNNELPLLSIKACFGIILMDVVGREATNNIHQNNKGAVQVLKLHQIIRRSLRYNQLIILQIISPVYSCLSNSDMTLLVFPPLFEFVSIWQKTKQVQPSYITIFWTIKLN